MPLYGADDIRRALLEVAVRVHVSHSLHGRVSVHVIMSDREEDFVAYGTTEPEAYERAYQEMMRRTTCKQQPSVPSP